MTETRNLRWQIATLDRIFLRGELSQIDRAECLARRRDLYNQLHPQAVGHGGDRRSDPRSKRGKYGKVVSFAKDAAMALGISVATVNRLLRRTKLAKGGDQ